MSRRHRGFTLVELLVVITIIGILMALLLPAVQYAVEVGRNTTCKNNQKQLATACVTFEASKNRLPGYTNKVGADRAAWIVQIMPNMERQNVYDTWEAGTMATPYIDMLVCPTDPPDSNTEPWNSYVGNAGFADFTNNVIANGIMHNYYPTKDTPMVTAPRGPYITTAQITDGATNTLLITENVQADYWNVITQGNVATATDKIATVFVFHADANSNAERKINGNKNSTSSPNGSNYARPSSHHSGGVNAAFADGRVIWLRQDIDYTVYQQLMTTRSAESAASGAPVLNGASYQ